MVHHFGEMKQLVGRFIERAINEKNLDAADDFLGTGYIDHQAPPGVGIGPEAFKKQVTAVIEAFPDLRVDIEDIIVEDDRVAVRWITRGTHKGEYLGIPSTGKSVAVPGIHVVRIVDGKIVEHWGVDDTLGLMQQIGIFPRS